MARLSRIAPELPVAGMAAAIAFYQRLGFALASQVQPGYAIVERDGNALHLFENDQHGASPVGIHLFTRDLAELYDEFAQRGVPFIQPIARKPWGNRDFRVKDDFGNELKFSESLAGGE